MLDYAFINGNILTAEDGDKIVEAVGFEGKYINIVGTNREVQKRIGRDTQLVDLEGNTMMPGIVDSHYHPILAGLLDIGAKAPMINTYIEHCKSLEEMLALLEEAVSLKKPGEWISMMGYEPSFFPENRHPTIEELNAISPLNPVHCMHGGGHICMYNNLALEYIGVKEPEDAQKYPDQEIEVIDGKLTGLVRGHTHFNLWGKVQYSEEAQIRAAMKSHGHCLKNGITSIHDCGELGKTSYHIMQKLCREGKFRVRTYMMLHSIFGKKFSKADNQHWLDLGLMSGLGDEHFKIGSSKFMIDGGSGGPSCYTRLPYSHNADLPREKGWEREEVAEYVELLNNSECQATAHAIGDGAVEYMVEAYEKAFQKNPRPALRHRIEHCTLADRDLIKRMATMNICPSVNVGQIAFQGANYKKFFGEERNHYICALRSMLDLGIKCSLQSDYPSGPAGLAVIDGAVNRYDRTQNEQCSKYQSISLLEAIKCATSYGAYGSYEEDIKGTISQGKLADAIILSQNIMTIDPMDINKVEVEKTFIDGELQYDKATMEHTY